MRNLKSLIIVGLFLFLIGCSVNNIKFTNEKNVITIAYKSAEKFEKDFGKYIKVWDPEIKYQIVPLTDLDDFANLANQRIDILCLTSEEYKTLIEKENSLLELDTFFLNDEKHFTNYHHGLLTYLRNLGGGKLYGITPFFSSKAIYMNLSLFDEFKIPYPQNFTTIEELIDVAYKFKGLTLNDKPVYGLDFRAPYVSSIIVDLAAIHNLSIYNEANGEYTMKTHAWEQVLDQASELIKSNIVSNNYSDQRSYFEDGNVAMVLSDEKILRTKGRLDFNWSVISTPTSVSGQLITPFLMTDSIFSINANSPLIEESWRLIKFINSEEIARFRVRGITNIMDPIMPAIKQEGWDFEGLDMSFNYSFEYTDWYVEHKLEDIIKFSTVLEGILPEMFAENATSSEILSEIQSSLSIY